MSSWPWRLPGCNHSPVTASCGGTALFFWCCTWLPTARYEKSQSICLESVQWQEKTLVSGDCQTQFITVLHLWRLYHFHKSCHSCDSFSCCLIWFEVTSCHPVNETFNIVQQDSENRKACFLYTYHFTQVENRKKNVWSNYTFSSIICISIVSLDVSMKQTGKKKSLHMPCSVARPSCDHKALATHSTHSVINASHEVNSAINHH